MGSTWGSLTTWADLLSWWTTDEEPPTPPAAEAGGGRKPKTLPPWRDPWAMARLDDELLTL
jgi:hypothetical protein